ncbi:MAG: hypothetical protein B7Z78_06300 [Rhodospirillales bacterium 20-60-12]|nr:MAG: hypothetical protein B7Z78_06300 [Rhodospirillales bacterium 20-60-12]HQT66028.1 hypothetical protein [Acetobacteraceae bacterium]
MTIGASQPFRPAGTVMLAAFTTAGVVTLPKGGSTVIIFNNAVVTAFVRFGSVSGLVATLSDMPVPPGDRLMLDVGALVNNASVVLASGTGNVYFSRGDGSVY